MKRAVFQLPFPPSVNHLFATNFKTKRRFKTKAYKAWQENALLAILPALHLLPKFPGKVALSITLGRPDKRKRDCSNYIKAPEDFIVSAGIIVDDSLVESLTVSWGKVDGCKVEIIEWTLP